MKREREKHITRLHLILFGFLVIVAIIIVLIIKGVSGGSAEKYKELEQEIVRATSAYIKINDVVVKDGYDKKINVEELVKSNNLQNDLINSCKGYVIISREKNEDGEFENVITPYIKCGNSYKSVNYEVFMD